MDPVTTSTVVASLAGTAINAYQRHQEKKRQEKIDTYNKELNQRNFLANQQMNSTAYQMQQMKNAGFNPLASDITPESSSPSANTSTLNPSPMETSSVGDSVTAAVNAVVASKAQELKADELEIQKQKLELEREQVLFNQRKAQVDQVTDMWNQGLIQHTDDNKAKLADYYKQRGFEMTVDSDGNIIAKDLAEIANINADVQLKQAQEKKVLQETETEKSNTLIAQAQAKYADRKELLRINQLTADIQNVLQDTGIKVKQQEALDIANDISRVQKKIADLDYNFMRSGVSVSTDPSVRAAVAQLCENHPAYWDAIMYKSFTQSETDRETYEEYLQWSNDVRHTDKTIEQTNKVVDGILNVVDRVNPRSWIIPKPTPVRPPLRGAYSSTYDAHGNLRGSRHVDYTY